MALPIELQQFKASGIYRLEFDKSQIASIPASQLRLVVGFSKKGPFNTPIFCPDPDFFQQVYGDIDKTLEKKSSYFHRTALAALEGGPILALNLLRLNDDTDSGEADEVEYQALSTAVANTNPAENEALYSGFYNKDKFWTPDSDEFLNNIGTGKELLNFVNLKQSPITILVRKAQTTTGYDVIAKEWFGLANVPEWMDENDYVSDYMIEVTVVKGDFTNYAKLSIDPIYGQYFHETKGIIKDQLDDFLDLREVEVLNQYTGSLIPDFVDLNGNGLYIEDLINFETSITGLYCAVDEDLFDDEIISGVNNGVDLVGHNLEYTLNNDNSFTRIKYLSYDRVIKDDLPYADSTTAEISLNVSTSEDISFSLQGGASSQTPPTVSSSDLVTVGSGDVNYIVAVGSTHSDYDTKIDGMLSINTPSSSTNRTVGSYVLMTDGSNYKWAPVTSLSLVSGVMNIGLSVEEAGYYVYLDGSNDMFLIYEPDWTEYDNSGGNGEFNGATASDLYDDFADGAITTGDQVWADGEAAAWYVKLTQFNDSTGLVTDNASGNGNGSGILGATYYAIPSVNVEAYEEATLATQADLPAPASNAYLESDGSTNSDELNIISLAGSLNVTMDTVAPSTTLPNNEVLVSRNDYETAVTVGDYLVAEEEGPNNESRLTKINKITIDGTNLHIYTDAAIKKTDLSGQETIERYRDIESIIEHYKMFALNGFTMSNTYHVPNGTQTRIDEIYADTLAATSNLFKALIDKNNITYRYIVDSFGLGIQTGSKWQLATLAKSRQNALALLNAPSIRDFKNSTDPKFTDITGKLQTRLIADGGDLTLNPDTVYSLPSIAQGSNYGTFFTPFFTIDRKRIAPPAGFVSNNYIDKYRTALPWSIVAGPRRGVVSGTGIKGLEINFDDGDREYLEPFGLNPIVFERGVGYVIKGNKTAQQNIQSALSSAHVREVLIYIQDGIAEILKLYQWEFNTVQTRLEIKTLADNFMRRVQNDNGVYFFQNVMDRSNNTNDVIQANQGVLDTYVEPVRGLEILVHRTTILKLGSIASGEFVPRT